MNSMLVATYVTRAHTFRRNIQTWDPNARSLMWVASLVRAITVSVFVKVKEGIILYILYRTFFSRHLSCVTGQTVRSQNIKYYGIPVFCRQKYITSFMSRPDLEWSRVKSRPTSIPLYIWYVLLKKWTPPSNIKLVALLQNIFLMYKLYVIVNDEIVPLHQRRGMGNYCWRVPVSSPQSPDCGDWGEPSGITTLTVREAAGWCNWEYLGNVSFFVSTLVHSGLLGAYIVRHASCGHDGHHGHDDHHGHHGHDDHDGHHGHHGHHGIVVFLVVLNALVLIVHLLVIVLLSHFRPIGGLCYYR